MSEGIYIIQAKCNGLVKIGKTKDISKRFLGLQSQSPCELEMIHFFETEKPRNFEMALHRMFWKYRHHAEWYDLTDREIAFLRSLSDDDYEMAMRYYWEFYK